MALRNGALVDIDLPADQQHLSKSNSTEVRALRDRLKLVWRALSDETAARQGLQDRLDRLTQNYDEQQQRLLKLEMLVQSVMDGGPSCVSPMLDETANGSQSTEVPSSHKVILEASDTNLLKANERDLASPLTPETVTSSNERKHHRPISFKVVVEKQKIINGTGKSLGLLLAGGDSKTPVFVHKVIPHGAVAQQGDIEVGDIIDEVDGKATTFLDIKEVYNILRQTSDTVHLSLRRDVMFAAAARGSLVGNAQAISTPDPFLGPPQPKIIGKEGTPGFSPIYSRKGSSDMDQTSQLPGPSSPFSNSFSRKSPTPYNDDDPSVNDTARLIVSSFLKNEPDHICATAIIHKDAGALGIAIKGGTSTSVSGVFVAEITENGAVAKEGTIQVNDRIILVNGTNVQGAKKKDVVGLLKSDDKLHITIARKQISKHRSESSCH